MEKCLITCFTHYQIIMAIQIRNSVLLSKRVTIAVADTSKGINNVVKRMQELEVFDDVIFLKIKYIEENFLSVKQIWNIAVGKADFAKRYLGEHPYFDEFWFFNNNITNNGFFCALYNSNSKLKCYGYEEGITTYEAFHEQFRIKKMFKRNKLIFAFRKILMKKNLIEATEAFFCLYPELYKGNLKVQSIRLFSNKSDSKLLADIYGVDTKQLKYEEKYIYFAGTYDFEGGKSLDEIGLIKKIAEMVGKENLLIKLHPRDFRDFSKMKKAGFHFEKNDGVPWEIIQLNYDFFEHVFLTILSNSILIANSMTEGVVKSFYLYKIIDGIMENRSAVVGIEALNYVKNILKNKGIHIVDSLFEIID